MQSLPAAGRSATLLLCHVGESRSDARTDTASRWSKSDESKSDQCRVNLSVYLSIYQFEKTEKKAGAGPLSSFFGTKRRTQGLYFPFVFLPSVFESPQSPDPVRTHFSRFVIFYGVGHIN